MSLLISGLLLLGLVAWLVFRAPKKTVQVPVPAPVPASVPGDSIPSERGPLTLYLKCNYERLERAKRSRTEREWILKLGRQFGETGIQKGSLSAREKFAAIFAVNQAFHENGDSRASRVKNYLQASLIIHNSHECQIRYIWVERDYRDIWEIKLEHWCTHLPNRIVQSTWFERSCGPRVRQILETYRPYLRPQANRISQ